MLISGQWMLGDDGVVRPVVRGELLRGDGSWLEAPFLVDSGADHTVLSALTLRLLGLPAAESPLRFGGVGGAAAAAVVETQLRFPQPDSVPVVFKGQFVAFTDPEALDLSVLGRDLTNLFAVIVDRPGDVVCLVGQRHRYRIESD